MSDAATRTLYEARGFAGRVGIGARPALLIVDLINAFTDATSPLGSNYDAEVEATRRLLEAARGAGAPVHFTPLALLREGTPAVEIDARLARRPGEVLWRKQAASAFFGTALAASLTAHGVDTVVVAGATTSGCVRASAVDACQHGFRTIVVREAVGDRARGPHDANLFDIDAKYGDVVGLDEVLGHLRGTSGAP